MLGLVLSLGLHWTVLQSAAWVGMVVAYAKSATLSEALEKTFDGAHPCRLCKIVDSGAKGEGDQNKSDTAAKVKKMDLILASIENLVVPTRTSPEFLSVSQSPLVRQSAPPVPPPRAI